jgi:hypothetical protein
MQLNVDLLHNKKVIMMNQFRKDHEKLKSSFSGFVRGEGTDIKSLKSAKQETRATEVQERAAVGSDQKDEGVRGQANRQADQGGQGRWGEGSGGRSKGIGGKTTLKRLREIPGMFSEKTDAYQT